MYHTILREDRSFYKETLVSMKSHVKRHHNPWPASNSGRNPKDIILLVSHKDGATIQEEREQDP